jgi:hypothetical protein
MTTVPAPSTPALGTPVTVTANTATANSGAISRMWDRHRRAAEVRRTRDAVARAMADAPTIAGRQELQRLLP